MSGDILRQHLNAVQKQILSNKGNSDDSKSTSFKKESSGSKKSGPKISSKPKKTNYLADARKEIEARKKRSNEYVEDMVINSTKGKLSKTRFLKLLAHQKRFYGK